MGPDGALVLGWLGVGVVGLIVCLIIGLLAGGC
jgi:hypothetical protein